MVNKFVVIYIKYRLVILALILLISIACFCQYSPYAHLLTNEEPNPQDIIGTYILKTQTLTNEKLEFLQGEQATLKINSDQTYQFTNFPQWSTLNYKLEKLIAGSGKWKIELVGGVSNGSDDNSPVWGIRLSGLGIYASFTGDDPPYGIIIKYGDADSGRVMIFEKIK